MVIVVNILTLRHLLFILAFGLIGWQSGNWRPRSGLRDNVVGVRLKTCKRNFPFARDSGAKIKISLAIGKLFLLQRGADPRPKP